MYGNGNFLLPVYYYYFHFVNIEVKVVILFFNVFCDDVLLLHIIYLFMYKNYEKEETSMFAVKNFLAIK